MYGMKRIVGFHLAGIALCVAGIAGVAITAGCGESTQNAPQGGDRNTAPATTINMPYGFRNVAFKCDGPNMVYVTSRGAGDGNTAQVSSLFVVANDPRCTGQR